MDLSNQITKLKIFFTDLGIFLNLLFFQCLDELFTFTHFLF